MSLKEFRDNLGLTQNQMADEIGVSKSYYSKVESGFQKPSFEFLRKLKSRFSDTSSLCTFGDTQVPYINKNNYIKLHLMLL